MSNSINYEVLRRTCEEAAAPLGAVALTLWEPLPYSIKFAKKAKIKIKFQKNEGSFFGQYPLIEKSPIATDTKYFLPKLFHSRQARKGQKHVICNFLTLFFQSTEVFCNKH